MQNRRSLDPEHRTLYGANLQPPAGYIFDAAVATTYTLDFETTLAAPVSMALFAAENRDDVLSHPLALLEGAERISGRLAVFADAGHIGAQERPHSRLCSLLERIIVEVSAPGGGVFHPKMWALRFTPLLPKEPTRLRLLVLSRNLTRDRSWDTALTLDGVVTKDPQNLNHPLADFLRRLPGLAVAKPPEGTRDLVDGIAEDLHHTEWTLPDSFESVAFAANGLGGTQWCPEPCTRLGVMSPFCDDETLSKLAGLPWGGKPMLIGRSDELAFVPRETLDRFGIVSVLDETAATEDGEEIEATALQGLHAKVFITERHSDTTITVGSGNATRPALLTGRNVEFFATLTGKKSRIGTVEQIFGEEGFGRLTRPFVPGELAEADTAQRPAEARLEDARRALCRAGLKLRCKRASQAEDSAALWQVQLVPSASLPLAGIGALRVWPITRGEGHARGALEALRQGKSVDLGTMPLADVTCFLACQLTAEDGDSILFSTGLVLEGLPPERHAAILRSVINNKDAFLRYLRLLLSEMSDPFAAALAAATQEDSGQDIWCRGSDDAPILEEMVRAFCRGDEELHRVERLVSRLETSKAGEEDPVPDEFRTLWNTFRAALMERGSKTQNSRTRNSGTQGNAHAD